MNRFDWTRRPTCDADYRDMAIDQLQGLKRMLHTRDYYDEHELLANVDNALRSLERIANG